VLTEKDLYVTINLIMIIVLREKIFVGRVK